MLACAAGRWTLLLIGAAAAGVFANPANVTDEQQPAFRASVSQSLREQLDSYHHGLHRDGATEKRYETQLSSSDCSNKDVAKCVSLLEVLTSQDLGFSTSVDELNRTCPVLQSGLECIDNFTMRCLSEDHRVYFNKLYAGTIRVIKELCSENGLYQQEYIRHAPCMRQVNPKYNKCAEVYHQRTQELNRFNSAVVHISEEQKELNVIKLCCSFQEYLLCSERVVYETCGNATAAFTKDFLDSMAGPIVQIKCMNYVPGSQQCIDALSSAMVHLLSKPSILTLVVSCLMTYFWLPFV